MQPRRAALQSALERERARTEEARRSKRDMWARSRRAGGPRMRVLWMRMPEGRLNRCRMTVGVGGRETSKTRNPRFGGTVQRGLEGG